jgi:hypothetical protein
MATKAEALEAITDALTALNRELEELSIAGVLPLATVIYGKTIATSFEQAVTAPVLPARSLSAMARAVSEFPPQPHRDVRDTMLHEIFVSVLASLNAFALDAYARAIEDAAQVRRDLLALDRMSSQPESLMEGITWPISRGPEQRHVQLWIDPGHASARDVQAVLHALNNVHIAAGGSGLTFRVDEGQILIVETAAI